MKSALILFFCFISSLLYADPDIKFYYEYGPTGYTMYADNFEVCPVTVEIDFMLLNLELVDGRSKFHVVPPRTTKHKLVDLRTINPVYDYSFQYTTKTYFGDPGHSKFDAVFQYYLPFKQGGSYRVKQGYFGSFSHNNSYAIDFEMPEGTEIYSARSGIVVDVVQDNDRSCSSSECAIYNNYVLIYHPDGTFAEYANIKKNGARVSKGDIVNRGQLLAYSGNVGWTTGPQLHFEVFLMQRNKRQSFKTNFLYGDGSDYSLLVENQRYSRFY